MFVTAMKYTTLAIKVVGDEPCACRRAADRGRAAEVVFRSAATRDRPRPLEVPVSTAEAPASPARTWVLQPREPDGGMASGTKKQPAQPIAGAWPDPLVPVGPPTFEGPLDVLATRVGPRRSATQSRDLAARDPRTTVREIRTSLLREGERCRVDRLDADPAGYVTGTDPKVQRC